jgi:hypothetical protein
LGFYYGGDIDDAKIWTNCRVPIISELRKTEQNIPSFAAVAIQFSPLDLRHCTAISDGGGAGNDARGLTF